jgi:hypothetical protein
LQYQESVGSHVDLLEGCQLEIWSILQPANRSRCLVEDSSNRLWAYTGENFISPSASKNLSPA